MFADFLGDQGMGETYSPRTYDQLPSEETLQGHHLYIWFWPGGLSIEENQFVAKGKPLWFPPRSHFLNLELKIECRRSF